MNKNPTNVIIDEAGSVGHMDCITDVLNIGRGYSIKLQLYYQDYAQLERCWPKGGAQGLLANTTSIVFGINDYQTAEMISKRCGQETVVVESGGWNSGTNRQLSSGQIDSNTGYSTGSNAGWQQQLRHVFTPDELMALPPRVALTFIPGMRPVASYLLRYYEEKKLFRRSFLHGVRAAVGTFVGSMMLLVMAVLVAVASTKFFEKEVLHGRQLGGKTVQHGQGEPQQRPSADWGGDEASSRSRSP